MQSNTTYPKLNEDTSFSDYIAACLAFIKSYRPNNEAEFNAPFEYRPDTALYPSCEYGVLMIHGLFDSPFTFRDVGAKLQQQGILARSILLPGHGTRPDNLMSINLGDWVKVVEYGVNQLKKVVKHVFLIGFSTGGALSIHHALNDPDIAGLILLAPALEIHTSTRILGVLKYLKNIFNLHNKEWIRVKKEIDYTKYSSITFHSVSVLQQLLEINRQALTTHTLSCPIYCIISDNDETISSPAVKQFLDNQKNINNLLLEYSTQKKNEPSPINNAIIRNAFYPELNINNFSHISLPFSPQNPHYGEAGDYPYAALKNHPTPIVYGAYEGLHRDIYSLLYRYGLIKIKRSPLTYNPDFEYMAESIANFILLANAKSINKSR